jgi:hypothetical protein
VAVTRREASSEARRRWGTPGNRLGWASLKQRKAPGRFRVGWTLWNERDPSMSEVHEMGRSDVSWEDAFTKAALRPQP